MACYYTELGVSFLAVAEVIVSTHCAYHGDQVELAWIAGYIPRWFDRPKMVNHPSTNRDRDVE